MKWIYISILMALLAICMSAKSQDSIVLYGEKPVIFNGRIASNFSWFIASDNGFLTKAKAGFAATFTADFRIARGVFVSTGVQYTLFNAGLYHHESNNIDDVNKLSNSVRESYLGIPLTMKFKTSPKKRHRFYGELGLDMGVRISSSITYDYVYMKKIKFGGVVGGGYEYYLKPNLGLQFGILYHAGFINTVKNIADDSSFAPPQSFDIVVGILF